MVYDDLVRQGKLRYVALARHPVGKGLSADDFSAPRDNLSEDEQSGDS